MGLLPAIHMPVLHLMFVGDDHWGEPYQLPQWSTRPVLRAIAVFVPPGCFELLISGSPCRWHLIRSSLVVGRFLSALMNHLVITKMRIPPVAPFHNL